MLQEIFTSDIFWFWTLVIVQSGLMIWFVETGSAIGAGTTLLTLIVGIAFFPGQWEMIGLGQIETEGFWPWLADHIWGILAIGGCYLMIGLAWATLRWWLFVRDLRELYDQRKLEWLAPGNLRRTASTLQSKAEASRGTVESDRFQEWADACLRAASNGGNQLTRELKPVWKGFVKNGFQH